MTEHIKPSSERHSGSSEKLISKEQHEADRAHKLEQARKALEKHAEENHDALKQEAAEHAAEADKQKFDLNPTDRDKDLALPGMQQSVKNNAYKRELAKIQSHLPATSRKFSKLIHNKTVESISNVGAETIARPSGLLGGSLVAFIGSLGTYIMARYYGFRYNYLMLFILFVGGFAIGAILEFIVWSLFRRRKHY